MVKTVSRHLTWLCWKHQDIWCHYIPLQDVWACRDKEEVDVYLQFIMTTGWDISFISQTPPETRGGPTKWHQFPWRREKNTTTNQKIDFLFFMMLLFSMFAFSLSVDTVASEQWMRCEYEVPPFLSLHYLLSVLLITASSPGSSGITCTLTAGPLLDYIMLPSGAPVIVPLWV